MRAVRILHCSDNLDNYVVCVENEVAGFGNRSPQKGDLIDLSYKVDNETLCGARFVLDRETDEKPWNDSERYVVSFKVRNVEYCKPFPLKIIGKIEQYWGAKYLQGSKQIKEKNVQDLLDKTFRKNHIEEFNNPKFIKGISLDEDSYKSMNEKYQEDPREKIESIEIMGTFQTIHFFGEQDKERGLEMLVTKNFFNLFPRYQEENSILISENRLFKTLQGKDKGAVIPDALLITFDKNRTIPFQINIIEYECYAEKNNQQKTEYLNKHIIPQLVQFASAFSTITDELTKKNTIETWCNKILDAIEDTENFDKAKNWLLKKDKTIKEAKIYLSLKDNLKQAFENSVQVVLIIDELSEEQKRTIENIIKSFLLENKNSIGFSASEVKLIQQITLTGGKSEFALTVR